MQGYSFDHIDNVPDYLDYREELRGRRENEKVMSDMKLKTHQELGNIVGFTGQMVEYLEVGTNYE